MYFIPDFDETTGSYGGEDPYGECYYYWGPIVDGLFNWETAWPKRGSPSPGTVGADYPGDISYDLIVQKGALAENKGLMIGCLRTVIVLVAYTDFYFVRIKSSPVQELSKPCPEIANS